MFDHSAESVSPIADEFRHLREELHRREEQLATQSVIEEAKGMLMQDFALEADEAFEVLASISKETNTGVREVAERLVHLLTDTVSAATAQRSAHTLEELRHRLTHP